MIPARMCLESLDRRPGIREQPGSNSEVRAGDREVGFAPMSGHSYERQLCGHKRTMDTSIVFTKRIIDHPLIAYLNRLARKILRLVLPISSALSR